MNTFAFKCLFFKFFLINFDKKVEFSVITWFGSFNL